MCGHLSGLPPASNYGTGTLANTFTAARRTGAQVGKMPAVDESASEHKHSGRSSREDVEKYKTLCEQLEAELADFQTSSRELEQELEKDIEASEKRERQLKEKVDNLRYEVEEWKVRGDHHLLLSWAWGSPWGRPNASSRNPRPALRKTACRKKSPHCETPAAPCS